MIDTDRKPMIIPNQDFKTVTIDFWFPYEWKEEGEIISSLLPSLLVHTSKECQTEKEFQRKLMELGILHMSSSRRFIATNGFYQFRLTLPDTTLLPKETFYKAISFFIDTVYEPNIKENTFDIDLFEKEKKRLITRVRNGLKNISQSTFVEVMNLVDTSGFLKNTIYARADELENMNNKDITSFYKQIVQTKKPIVLVIGNVEKSEMEQFLEKELRKRKVQTIQIEKKYTCFLKSIEKAEIEKSTPFKQSAIFFSFKVSNMKETERLLFNLVNSLLVSEASNLLYKKLRGEEGLVYTTDTSAYGRYGMLFIEAYAHKSSYPKIKQKVKELMELLQDKEVIEPLLENIKKQRRIGLKRMLDRKNAILGNAIDVELGFDVSIEEEYEQILKIQASELAIFAKRFTLELIYFAKGDGHEN